MNITRLSHEPSSYAMMLSEEELGIIETGLATFVEEYKDVIEAKTDPAKARIMIQKIRGV